VTCIHSMLAQKPHVGYVCDGFLLVLYPCSFAMPAGAVLVVSRARTHVGGVGVVLLRMTCLRAQ
jgi:hypothetical protein